MSWKSCHGLRHRSAAADLRADPVQCLLEARIDGAFRQEIKHLQDREAGPHERHEFLIEHQKFPKREPTTSESETARFGTAPRTFKAEEQPAASFQLRTDGYLTIALETVLDDCPVGS